MSRAVALLLLAGVATGAVFAYSIWTPIGPAASTVLCGAVSSSNPSVMLIATSKGTTATLFLTTDRGVSWSIVSDSLGFRPQAISFQPGSDSIVYAVDSKVYRSTDRGQTWSQLVTPDATVWCNLEFGAADTNEIWLAGYYLAAGADGRAAAAVSTDAGASWTTSVCDSAVRSYSYSIAIDPTHGSVIYCGGSIAGRAVVYKSTDRGWSWARHDLPISVMPDSVEPDRPPPQGEPVNGRVRFLYIDRTRPTVLLAAMTWYGVFRSVNAGATWTHYGGIHEAHSLASVPLRPEVVFVGATNGIYKTVDAGANWGGPWQPPSGGQVGCVLVPDDVTSEALAATGSAVFRTTDEGQSWDATGILDTVTITALEVVQAASQFVYTAIAGAGVFRSTNSGDGWSRCQSFPGSDSVVSIAAASATEVWALTDSGLYYSMDSGGSWAFRGDWFDHAGAVSVSPLSADFVVATGSQFEMAKTSRFAISPAYDRVYVGSRPPPRGLDQFAISVTTDHGQNWSHLLLCTDGMGRAVALSPADFGRFVAAGESAGTAVVFTSRDTGRTWDHTQAGLTGTVRSVEFELPYAEFLYCGTSNGVFESPDTGNHWYSTGLSRVNAIVVPQGWWPFAGTDVGVFQDYRGWLPYSSGLVDSNVTSMAAACGTLYAGTRTAGLFRGYAPVGIGDRPADAPRRSRHFGPTIVHGVLVLPAKGEGRMATGELLDVSGRKVLDLRPGPNEISRLAPGAYFVREEPQAPSFRSRGTWKIVLTR